MRNQARVRPKRTYRAIQRVYVGEIRQIQGCGELLANDNQKASRVISGVRRDLQSEVMKTKADAFIYYFYKDTKYRALFPMIRAIIFMLLERNEELPLSPDYLKRVKDIFKEVTQIQKDIYMISKYRRESVDLIAKPTL